MASGAVYIHALRYQWLNCLYDPVVRVTTRETAVKQALIGLLPPIEHGEFLDLACGTGTLTRAIKSAVPDAAVRGIDGDRDMLVRARGNALTANLEVDYDHGLAQQLPYADDSFDVVTSSLFFHHLSSEGKRAAFREIRRVLKPAGTVLIADWGRPQNKLQRILFVLVQLVDGFETTDDNLRGLLPGMLEAAGFSAPQLIRNMMTPLGTIAIIRASECGPRVANNVERSSEGKS